MAREAVRVRLFHLGYGVLAGMAYRTVQAGMFSNQWESHLAVIECQAVAVPAVMAGQAGAAVRGGVFLHKSRVHFGMTVGARLKVEGAGALRVTVLAGERLALVELVGQ